MNKKNGDPSRLSSITLAPQQSKTSLNLPLFSSDPYSFVWSL